MKKISVLLFAMVCALGMSATIQSKVGIYMYSDSYTSLEEAVLLGVGDSYDPFDVANCANFFGVGANTSNYGVYATYQGINFSELYAPEIVNVPLVVITNRANASKQGYSFFFDWDDLDDINNTQPLYLTDLRPEAGHPVPYTFEIVKGEEYFFDLSDETAYQEGKNSVIADRFVLNYDPTAVVSLTTNEEGWASFAYTANVVPVDNSLKMYTGAINDDELLLMEVGYVKAGAGVVVKGAANTTYDFKKGTAYGNFSLNDLIGCPVATAVLAGTNFVLSYKNGATAFYEYTGSEIPAHKAYLNFPASTPAPQRIRMVINQEQAIENVTLENVKAEKFVENGEIFIRRGNEVFNLQGQIVK